MVMYSFHHESREELCVKGCKDALEEQEGVLCQLGMGVCIAESIKGDKKQAGSPHTPAHGSGL